MAHYLLRIPDVPLADQYQIVESESAKQAVEFVTLLNDNMPLLFEVWTLRSIKPRIFEVSTESVRTVKRVE